VKPTDKWHIQNRTPKGFNIKNHVASTNALVGVPHQQAPLSLSKVGVLSNQICIIQTFYSYNFPLFEIRKSGLKNQPEAFKYAHSLDASDCKVT
jgi:hypothetical protein